MIESSQRLSIDVKNNYSEILRKEISGFRSIHVHDYLGIDLDMILSVVEQDLSNLEQALIKEQSLK